MLLKFCIKILENSGSKITLIYKEILCFLKIFHENVERYLPKKYISIERIKLDK